MIKAEWLNIFKNRKMLIAIIAVLMVPVLYAGMFLWAFWDPYDKLEDMPVAIVNNDVGATVEGKHLELGKDLSKNLMDSKQFKFKELTSKEATQEMKDRKQYITIEIPKDFSKNAGSLLEDDPEKMKLIYKPNEGFNFLGGQIGNSAIELIRAEVNKKVSATYAEQLFANIAKLGDGLGDAADGAGKLGDGAVKLNKGAITLKDGLVTLEDGSGKLADGAKSAANGSNDLVAGVNKLLVGANKLNDGASSAAVGANKLNAGTSELATGATKLNDGAKSASAGANTLNSKLGDAQAGANKLQNGAASLQAGTSEMASKLNQNTGNITALNDGAQKISAGINGDGSQANPGVKGGLAQLTPGAAQVDAGITKLIASLKSLPATLNELKTSSVQLDNGSGKVAQGATNLQSGAAELKSGTTKLAGASAQLVQQIQAMNIPEADKAKLLATANAVNDGVKNTDAGVGNIQSGAASLSAGANDLHAGTTKLKNKVNDSNSPTISQDQTNDMEKLQQGAHQVATGLSTLNTKVANELAPGANKLATGTKTLANSWSASVEGANKLNAGATALNNGVGDLGNGIGQLHTGAGSLANGLGTLTTGTGSLVGGIGQLQQGSSDLANGLAALPAGTSSLVQGTTTLRDGSSTLSSGLNEMADKTGGMIDGVTKLANGSEKLADGTKDLAKGSDTLETALADGHEQASEVHPTDKTYDMVGQPVVVQKEAVNEVPNYGTGFAPYFIALGLFVGALLITIVFPLVEPAIRPKSGAAWYASKAVVLAVVGFLQALLAVLIVKYSLGMEVYSMVAFFFMALITSYAFLAITQMLVSILGDPGRFIAIIILILQLTTSAGTFPLELVPGPLQIFNKLLPMTYSVSGFKSAISTGDMSYYWMNFGVLAAFAIIISAITFGYFALVFKKRHSAEIDKK